MSTSRRRHTMLNFIQTVYHLKYRDMARSIQIQTFFSLVSSVRRFVCIISCYMVFFFSFYSFVKINRILGSNVQNCLIPSKQYSGAEFCISRPNELHYLDFVEKD